MASDPIVSRVVAQLAGDTDASLMAITGARAAARERAWQWAGAPVQDGQVVIDLDATLLDAHIEKEDATRTWKKGFGVTPLARVRRSRYRRRWGAGRPRPLRPHPHLGESLHVDRVVAQVLHP